MRTLCGCQWIDAQGAPTPDANPPIGIALCRDTDRHGVIYGGGFAICATHAAHLPSRSVAWPGTDHTVVTEWTIEPFAP